MFITLEGTEGSGKSTQARLLADYLRDTGRRVVEAREPGGTALGDALRQLLLDASNVPVDARTEVLLFSAARAQLVAEVIRPQLASGAIVICDRFSDSTVAYQAFGRGLDRLSVQQVIDFATCGLMPRLTVLLDLAPEEGLRRNAAHKCDRFERESLEFHCRVRDGYLELARSAPERWLVLDARLAAADIAERVRARVEVLVGD